MIVKQTPSHFPMIITTLLFLCTLISCQTYDCDNISDSFVNYNQALNLIHSTNFKYSDECNTSKSSWIKSAEYFSCNGETGYLIIETKSDHYIHSDIPKALWKDFKKADSFGSFYNSRIKNRYQLNL